ncbi:MAG: uroporphyrinogen-III synthase [Alphaproteobacteria bacterium]|nr:uroporphyrinogen-III synthase [Alphaproteobacteria bacterium]
MKLVVTRPEADAPGLAAALRARGHEVVLAPLLAIVPRRDLKLAHSRYQAVAVTSANGPRSFPDDLVAQIGRATPVLAVGAQSAAAARGLGFTTVVAEGGDVHGLAAAISSQLSPAAGPILYVSGAETSGDLEGQLTRAGFSVERLVTYDAVAQKLDKARAAILAADGVLLYSPRSAKLWVAELQHLGLGAALARLRHFCLSAQVAAALPANTHISIAEKPAEQAMLALLDLAGKAE